MADMSDEEWVQIHSGAMTNTTPDSLVRVSVVQNTELICPAMSNKDFGILIMKLRDQALRLIKIRMDELEAWTPAAQRRVQRWFGISDNATRSILGSGLPRLYKSMTELRPENIIRYSEERGRNISCAPVANIQDTAASVCKPDSARRIIAIYPKFCAFPDAELFHNNKLSAIVHECTHFSDTFDSADKMYAYKEYLGDVWAQKKPDLAITNADSLTMYITYPN